MINIQFLNLSTKLTQAQAQIIVSALQVQVSRDFYPAWGVNAALSLAPAGTKTPTAGSWVIGFFDNADMAGCFTGDTKVSLLDGRDVSFANLAKEFGEDKPFWIYSCDPATGKVVAGLAHGVHVTHQNAELVLVELDNGEKIRCTPNHRFMRKDGSYTAAADLQPGDSLMPLYRSLSDQRQAIIGYEMVHSGVIQARRFTHRIVADLVSNGSCELCGADLPDKNHIVRHHRNFQKVDNRPDNIQWVTEDEHLTLHRHLGRENLLRLWKNPEFRARRIARASIVGKTTFQANFAEYYGSEKNRETGRRVLTDRWVKDRDRQMAVCALAGKAGPGWANLRSFVESEAGIALRDKNVADHLIPYAKSEELRALMRVEGLKRLTAWNQSEDGRAASVSNATAKHASGVLKPKLYAHNRWHLNRGLVNPECAFCAETNHKVIAVTPLSDREDVYDLTVDKYHNFALASGVFVHNSLGYHDITIDGLPLGKVFVETTILDHQLVSVTASHETVEMLCDPSISICSEVDNKQGAPSRFLAFEIADPVEADELGYPITTNFGTVKVSDFVFPSWFEAFRAPRSTVFDFTRKLTQPFQILPGGYIGMLDLANLRQGWQQLTRADDPVAARRSRPPVGSRRERRSIPRSQWQASSY